jgi:alkylation response protein AidB-like acyl-CoA dehydrogenase
VARDSLCRSRSPRRRARRSHCGHIFRTHFWFVGERLRTADDASSARWLHKVAEGKIFGNAFSEKGSLAVGSLIFNTRLLPAEGGGYRLNGEKYYSTGTHNSVADKARALGQKLLHGTPVPANAYF